MAGAVTAVITFGLLAIEILLAFLTPLSYLSGIGAPLGLIMNILLFLTVPITFGSFMVFAVTTGATLLRGGLIMAGFAAGFVLGVVLLVQFSRFFIYYKKSSLEKARYN